MAAGQYCTNMYQLSRMMNGHLAKPSMLHIYIYIFFFPLHLYHDIPIHQHPAIQLYMFHGYQFILYLERNQIVLEGAGTRGPGAVRCVRGQPWIR